MEKRTEGIIKSQLNQVAIENRIVKLMSKIFSNIGDS